jgi:electron transfer flavoprotein beta subunit
VVRHIDGGVETVETELPCMLTVNGSAAACRPRNAKRVMAYKKAEVPHLTCADVEADLNQCGLAGSPTKVKHVENIVFKAKESKQLTGSDEDINGLIQELLASHTIG